MKSTDIPTKFPIPFGNAAAAGTIRPIPVLSQTSTDVGQASLTDGFPVATGQPLASGGKPPAMQDFNGLLNQITAWSRWQNAGALTAYDATFATAIGGYPQGAVLASTTAGFVWLNLADNNTTNPDSGSAANWIAIATAASLAALQIAGNRLLFDQSSPGAYSFTIPAGVYTIRIQAWGGGGAGGGSYGTGAAGAGGGGGGYAEGSYAVTPGQVLTINVGAGGVAVATTPSGGGNGGAGGASTVSGSGVTGLPMGATGGSGGGGGLNAISQVVGGGGTANGGQTNRPGYSGGGGVNISGGPLSGAGGPAYQTSNASGNQGTAGTPGYFPAGGGAGAALSTGAKGGDGASGWIRIFG